MIINLPYERQAARSDILPPDLDCIDVLAFYALRHIYSQYSQKSISKERGAAMKSQLMFAYSGLANQLKSTLYYGKLIQFTEIAKISARKNPCAETALALAEAIDGRGWEKLTEENLQDD